MLAFLLHGYDPAMRQQLRPDYHWLAEIQALDRRNRTRLADWGEAPLFPGDGLSGFISPQSGLHRAIPRRLPIASPGRGISG